jgi:hypothetical protein
MGWDGMGWDGMGWDGMGWDGMGWPSKHVKFKKKCHRNYDRFFITVKLFTI